MRSSITAVKAMVGLEHEAVHRKCIVAQSCAVHVVFYQLDTEETVDTEVRGRNRLVH